MSRNHFGARCEWFTGNPVSGHGMSWQKGNSCQREADDEKCFHCAPSIVHGQPSSRETFLFWPDAQLTPERLHPAAAPGIIVVGVGEDRPYPTSMTAAGEGVSARQFHFLQWSTSVLFCPKVILISPPPHCEFTSGRRCGAPESRASFSRSRSMRSRRVVKSSVERWEEMPSAQSGKAIGVRRWQ